jgi:short subunit dehydrogenase-like uncharacterized protein
MENREFDIILYGATGFTGQLAAEYLALKTDLPPERWAIAGRNQARLEKVREGLCRLDPACSAIAVILADSGDRPGLKVMAGRTKIIATTVGPYALYGEELVQACAMMGTHYLDITGEPNFVSNLLDKYDALARQNNALIINCCGFDSIPADLGAYYTAGRLQNKEEITIKAFVSSKGSFSGGTWASALNAMAEGIGTKKKGSAKSQGRLDKSIHFDKTAGKWAVPMPVIDPWMVKRSSAEHPGIYGSQFEYGQYLGLKSVLAVGGLLAGVGLVYAGAQVKPIRNQMLKFRKPGEGPDEEARAKHWFRLTFFGTSGNERVKATVSGGDPGYGETSKMLAESALTVLYNYDKLNVKGGVTTPAGALGEHLMKRLQAAGIRFESEKL